MVASLFMCWLVASQQASEEHWRGEHPASLDVDIVFVYDDPQYDGRLGFDAGIAAKYTPPCQLQYPFGWQARPLADSSIFPSSGKLTCVQALRNPRLG